MIKTKSSSIQRAWRVKKARAWMNRNYNRLTILLFAPICVFVFIASIDTYFTYESYYGISYRIMTAMALLTMAISTFCLWIVERLYYISVSKANDGDVK